MRKPFIATIVTVGMLTLAGCSAEETPAPSPNPSESGSTQEIAPEEGQVKNSIINATNVTITVDESKIPNGFSKLSAEQLQLEGVESTEQTYGTEDFKCTISYNDGVYRTTGEADPGTFTNQYVQEVKDSVTASGEEAVFDTYNLKVNDGEEIEMSLVKITTEAGINSWTGIRVFDTDAEGVEASLPVKKALTVTQSCNGKDVTLDEFKSSLDAVKVTYTS